MTKFTQGIIGAVVVSAIGGLSVMLWRGFTFTITAEQQQIVAAQARRIDELEKRIAIDEGAANVRYESQQKWMDLLHYRLDETRRATNIGSAVGVP